MDVPLDAKAAQPRPRPIWQGRPGGTKTGTVNDVRAADATKGVTLADVVNQAGQNRIAINFVWTLVTGFLVHVHASRVAIVETGLFGQRTPTTR